MSGLLVPTASRQEWLRERQKGVSASEIAVILGLSPWDSPYALYHRKTGVLPEQDQTDAMALGKHMESFVAERFAERHPEFYVEGDGELLYSHPERPWQLATPDRTLTEKATQEDWPGFLAAEPVAVLECKIDGGSDGWGEDGTGEIPVHYRCQVLWQMDVLGVTTGYVACLLWQSRKVRVYELAMDAQATADLALMRKEAGAFLDRFPAHDEPDVDWRPATADALKRLYPGVEDRDAHIGRQLEISYRSAVRRHKEAERRKDEMTNRLRAAMGSARRAVAASTYGLDGDRVVIATRSVYPVKEHVRRASTVDKLIPAKGKS